MSEILSLGFYCTKRRISLTCEFFLFPSPCQEHQKRIPGWLEALVVSLNPSDGEGTVQWRKKEFNEIRELDISPRLACLKSLSLSSSCRGLMRFLSDTFSWALRAGRKGSSWTFNRCGSCLKFLWESRQESKSSLYPHCLSTEVWAVSLSTSQIITEVSRLVLFFKCLYWVESLDSFSVCALTNVSF